MDRVDEARAVLARLERIEALESAETPAEALLEEVRLLVREAREWVAAEGNEEAERALERCREALACRTAV